MLARRWLRWGGTPWPGPAGMFNPGGPAVLRRSVALTSVGPTLTRFRLFCFALFHVTARTRPGHRPAAQLPAAAHAQEARRQWRAQVCLRDLRQALQVCFCAQDDGRLNCNTSENLNRSLLVFLHGPLSPLNQRGTWPFLLCILPNVMLLRVVNPSGLPQSFERKGSGGRWCRSLIKTRGKKPRATES